MHWPVFAFFISLANIIQESNVFTVLKEVVIEVTEQVENVVCVLE